MSMLKLSVVCLSCVCSNQHGICGVWNAEMVAAFEIGALSSVLEKLKRRPTSVVVITFALHAKGREFEPHVDQFFVFFVCFLVTLRFELSFR